MPYGRCHIACAPEKTTSSNPQWPAETGPEADSLFRALRTETASFAVVVDAKDGNARRLCERESFLQFADQPLKLFCPI